MKSTLLVTIGGVFSVRLSHDAQVEIDCSKATGTSMSCDWKCYDACIAPHIDGLTLTMFMDCLQLIHGDCIIDAKAYMRFEPEWYCTSLPSALASGTQYQGYAIKFPDFSSSEGLHIPDTKLESVSVDIDAPFDIKSCKSLINYSVSNNSEQTSSSSVCNNPIPVGYDYTKASFGIHRVNLNFTTWAQLYETNTYSNIGEQKGKDLIIQFSTLGPCWARATNMRIFYSASFRIDTATFNSAAQIKFLITLLATIVQILSNL